VRVTLRDVNREAHPALNGWLVTRHDLCVAVMRDSVAFTVAAPRGLVFRKPPSLHLLWAA
jgi:hypothetical protein